MSEIKNFLLKEDYEEPACPLCMNDKKDGAPKGRIPVARIIEKVDAAFEKNDMTEAQKVLEYWLLEAEMLLDKQGELAVTSELIGLYRKMGEKGSALKASDRAIILVDELGKSDSVSGATVYINCATALKAFGFPEKALPLYKKAEKIYISRLKPLDEKFGGLYNNMALALADLGNAKEAEELYKRAIEVMNNAEQGELEIAITYINMAHMYEKSNMCEKIVDCLEIAYALLMTESLPKNGYYAFVISKCAPSYEYFGMYDISDKLTKIAGEIYADN